MGFLSGEQLFKIWVRREREIWISQHCYESMYMLFKTYMYIVRNALVCTWLGLCGVTMFLTPALLYVRTS